jgi:competence protein ComEC
VAPRDVLYDCDRWSCAPRGLPAAPAIAAIWSRKPVERARVEALCRVSQLVIVRARADPASCPRSLVLTAEDFARGGAVELYRTSSGWRAVWAQDMRGRRPWTWNQGRRFE